MDSQRLHSILDDIQCVDFQYIPLGIHRQHDGWLPHCKLLPFHIVSKLLRTWNLDTFPVGHILDRFRIHVDILLVDFPRMDRMSLLITTWNRLSSFSDNYNESGHTRTGRNSIKNFTFCIHTAGAWMALLLCKRKCKQ